MFRAGQLGHHRLGPGQIGNGSWNGKTSLHQLEAGWKDVKNVA